MTNLEPTSTGVDVREQLIAWLAKHARLEADEIVTGATLVFCTEKLTPQGRVAYRHGRAFPLGDVSTTKEIGLIAEAAVDLGLFGKPKP